MSTKLIMVRHGFSVSNNLKVFTGQSDIELDDIGRRQALLCGEYFKDWSPCSVCGEERAEKIWDMGISSIDAIYSSDLSRAYDTALEIGKVLGLEVEKNRDLREIYAGRWEMMSFTDIDEKYSREYDVWKNDIGRAVCVGGESVAGLAERIKKTVVNIAARHDGGAVVIVTHATPIRVISTLAEGFDLSDMARVSWVSNASVSVFEFDGSFREVRKNITSHLGSLKTDLPRGV